jgi:single stranded DNA-binding protein
MRALNSVILVGTVGADPVFRTSPAGLCCELSLASSETVRTRQGDRVRTEWVRVRLGARAAEICQRAVRKGHLVGVEGRLRCRATADRHGRIVRDVYVQAQRLHLLEGRPLDAPPARLRVGERTHPAFRAAPPLQAVPDADPTPVGGDERRPLRAG